MPILYSNWHSLIKLKLYLVVSDLNMAHAILLMKLKFMTLEMGTEGKYLRIQGGISYLLRRQVSNNCSKFL